MAEWWEGAPAVGDDDWWSSAPVAEQGTVEGQPDPVAAEAARGSRIGEFFKTVDSAVRSAADAITFGLADEISAGLGAATGIGGRFGDYSTNLEAQRATDRQRRQEDPIASIGGSVAGAIGAGALAAPFLAAPAALGGRVLQGVRLGAASGGAYGYGSGEGGVGSRAQNALVGAGVGGFVGAAAPVALAGAGAGVNALKDAASRRYNAIVRPEVEAQRRVGNALAIDRESGVPIINELDEGTAALHNLPLINVDRGGETVRALARSAANLNPEARSVIERTASDRFALQGERARTFLDRIMGGATDDLALQERIQRAARNANRPAYRKAYEEGAEIQMTPELERLVSSPSVVEAMRKVATGKGRDRAVAEGFGTFNPNVIVTPDGRIIFRKGKDASGAYPDLQFWDFVKRELDDMANSARRGGRDSEASTLGTLARTLREELDEQVPSYREARAGAAAFFDAEDALDAGRKFVTQNRRNAEVSRILKAMSEDERQAFAVGFASELKDAIAQAGDRVNVISRLFGSEQAREKIRLALGPARYREFEKFVKIETIMDQIRGAMGNSTTARQLVELGLAGGTGFAFTGSLTAGAVAAVLTRAAQATGKKIEGNVAKHVARLLISDDPRDLKKAVQEANKSRNVSAAIDHLFGLLGQGGAIAAGQQGADIAAARKPLEITVTRGTAASPQ